MRNRIVMIGLMSLAIGICQLTIASEEEKTEHKEAAAVYTCPMHPEVQQNTPGKCPKCGMDLVEKEATTTIPSTVAGIWTEVKKQEEQLGKLIADKNLDKVHALAFEIRDLVNALPDKSADLAADKLAMLKANVKYVADLAKRLDESGDANDQALTEASFKKLEGILKTIEAQYPAETLKVEATKG